MRLIDAEELPLDPCVPNTFIGRDYAFGYNDMLRNILKAPAIAAYPCTFCVYGPPSSGDGKPCTMCPAKAKRKEGE